jgi:multidrug efflux pump subunit AcrB
MKNIVEFFIRNPRILKLIKLLVVIVGLFQLQNILVDSFPQVPLDMVAIETLYPGASPGDIEKDITKKIEDELKNISNIKKYQSITVENFSTVIIELNKSVSAKSKKDTVDKIKTTVENIRDFPPEAEKPLIRELDINSPLLNIAVSSYPENEATLRYLVDDLEEELKQIKSVSKVEKWGYRDQEVIVEVEPGLLRSYNLTLGHVINTIQNNNLNLPAGDGVQGNRDLWIRSIGEATQPQELNSHVIRSNFEGARTRIGDIGNAYVGFKKTNNFLTANGRKAVVLTLYRNETGHILKMSKAIHKKIEQFNKLHAGQVKAYVYNDNSRWIQNRLQVLTSDAVTGFIFLAIFLMFFLELRTGFEAALEIPTAFLLTVIFMSMAGISFNAISLLGLIMVSGLLVDDAIIISENIHRHMEMGKPPAQAAVDGLNEVSRPVFMTIITTILGFMPLALMTGIIGEILRIIPLIMIFALTASGLQSFLSLPAMLAEAATHTPVKHGNGKKKLKDRMLDGLTQRYQKVASKIFSRKYLALGLVFLCFILSLVFASQKMRFVFIPEDILDNFYIRTESPVGTTLEQNYEKLKLIENKIRKYPPSILRHTIVSVGSSGEGQRDSEILTGKRYGQIAVFLTQGNTRSIKTSTIIEDLRQHIEKMKFYTEFTIEEEAGGPPAPKPIYIQLKGPDFARLDSVGKEIYQFVKSIQGTKEVQYSYDSQNPELHLKLRQDQISRLGLSNAQVAQEVRAVFDGVRVGKMSVGNETLDIRVKLKHNNRSALDLIGSSYVDNGRGGFIPMLQLIKVEEVSGPSRIIHEDGKRLISIQGLVDIKKTSAAEVMQKVKAKFPAPFQKDRNYSMEFAGENKETTETLLSMLQAFGLAMMLVFVCLVGYFNSVLLPLVVMISIPLSIIGVIAAFFIHQSPLSFPAMMGIVALGGIVVKDGIVLVTFIEGLRAKGMQILPAVLEGTKIRIRPIILTSSTVLLGLFPTAYGIGGYDPFVRPLALSFAWGLAFSTLLTLFIIPCIYLVLDDFNNWKARHPFHLRIPFVKRKAESH